MEINEKKLVEAAEEARRASYSPYSHFSVGAALLCSDGKIYLGCNIENASFTPTCCAERVAVFKAVSEGRRDFVAIAIVGAHHSSQSELCYPCGVCRQVLSEFCSPDMRVIMGSASREPVNLALGELLPYSFKLEQES